MTRRLPPSALAGLAAALLCAATLAFFWPGVAMYDSVVQYGQVLAGAYDDWHPPVMARLWALLHILWAGQAPMFALQLPLYWAGLGLFAVALARGGNRLAAAAVLALGLWPPFFGWEAIVIKDGQMASALLAATGLAAHWRLRGARLPRWAATLVLLLLAYATLTRFNAVFATVPLAFGLLGGGLHHRPVRRGIAMIAATGMALAAVPLVNHHLLGATPSGVERSLPTYDLAGITRFAGPAAAPVLPAATWRDAQARHCITPLLWDPLGDEAHCGFVAEGLDAAAPGRLLVTAWISTILHHPFAYAAHRLTHWNATMRALVPWHMPATEPPSVSEPNAIGLASPAKRIAPFQILAGWLAESPLGAPIVWLAAALAVLALSWRGETVRDRIGFALASSAVATELSFLLVSIAADVRYHLWAMLATGLAVLAVAGTPRPRARLAIAAVLLVALLCLAARLIVPPFDPVIG